MNCPHINSQRWLFAFFIQKISGGLFSPPEKKVVPAKGWQQSPNVRLAAPSTPECLGRVPWQFGRVPGALAGALGGGAADLGALE